MNATVTDFPFDILAPCAATVPAPLGSTCSIVTSFDTLIPGTVLEEQRMSFGTYDEIVAIDPGPVDGVFAGAGCPPTCRTGDEGTHRRAGQFAP